MAIRTTSTSEDLQLVDPPEMDLPDGDWAMGMWCFATGAPTNSAPYFFGLGNTTTTPHYFVRFDKANGPYCQLKDDEGQTLPGDAFIGILYTTYNVWFHIFLCRRGENIYLSLSEWGTSPGDSNYLLQGSDDITSSGIEEFTVGSLDFGISANGLSQSSGSWDTLTFSDFWKGDFTLSDQDMQALGAGGVPIMQMGKPLDIYLPLWENQDPHSPIIGSTDADRIGSSNWSTEECPPTVMGYATRSRTTKFLDTYVGAVTPTGAVAKQPQLDEVGATTPSGAATMGPQKVHAGSLTSDGTIAHTASNAVAGSLTSAGALLHQTIKAYIGSLSSSGALSNTKLVLLSIAGTLSSAGSIVKKVILEDTPTFSRLTGKINTMAGGGSLTNQAQKTYDGAITSAGSTSSLVGQILGGALTSGGSLVHQVASSITGALTSTGSLIHQASVTAVGSLTSAGDLTPVRTVLTNVAGVVTPAGTLVHQVAVSVGGAITSAGVAVMSAIKSYAGTTTSSGEVANIRTVLASMEGATTPTGLLKKLITATYDATLSSAGALVSSVATTISGTFSSAGTVAWSSAKGLGGLVSSAGTAAATIAKSVSGAWTPAGAVSEEARKSFSGSTTPTGDSTSIRGALLTVAGSVASAGSVTLRAMVALAGLVGSAGAIVSRVAKALAGVITPAGAVSSFTTPKVITIEDGSVLRAAMASGAVSRSVIDDGAVSRATITGGSIQ